MAKRVLLVDDDKDFLEATELILSEAGYETTKAINSIEAMEQLQAERVDLVLLDVMMETDTEGFHLAYKIRDDDRLKDVRIVILTCIEETTGVDLEPSRSGDFLPVDGYLRKPLDAELLESTVAELIGLPG